MTERGGPAMPKESSRALLAATLMATLPGAVLAQEADASYYLQNFEVGDYIPWGNQPRTPTCRNTTDQPF
jgi:hypothetical protein